VLREGRFDLPAGCKINSQEYAVALRGAAARRYAEAVFNIAQESNTLDRWLEDLKTLNNIFGRREVIEALENPRLDEQDWRKIISDLLPAGSVSDLAVNFLLLLLRRHRLHLLPRIVELYQEMYNRAKGIVVAEVTTAAPLDEEHKRKIAAYISQATGGKKVEMRIYQDPRILGGFVARIGDNVIDASVSRRLAELAQRLS
jgi:F-type H+-transporting ATPase subunit delta